MDPVARLIDANANRAREALRVMEDVARFALGDGELCGSLKALRHELRDAIDGLAAHGLDRAVLIANRDTEGDVGTSISTSAERERGGLRDMALAAAARLTEALRSIEEGAKIVEGRSRRARSAATGLSAPIEALRYRAYTAEKQLVQALGTGRCPQWRLCVLITESLCLRPGPDVAAAAVEGGADCLQLREKSLDGGELLARARRLVELARTRGAAVFVNDRADVALAAGADGVHLGQTDLPIAETRAIAGDRLLIGASTTNLDQARAAAAAGADYCGLGPMFSTTTKHTPVLAGPAYLREYLADEALNWRPHLAIGGITPQNASALRDAGARGIAVSSAVCAAADPAEVCRGLLSAMGAGQREIGVTKGTAATQRVIE